MAGRGLPHSAQWGAFSVLLDEEGIEIVPHPQDPDPSALLGNIPASASHPARIARPMVRRGWLDRGPGADNRRGRDEFVPVSWLRALDLVAAELRRVYAAHGPRAIFGGSYGWASAGRFHDAQSQIHRFLNLAGGYVRSIGSYSSGAASVILPYVIGPQGAVAGNNVSWAELVSEGALVLAFGGMALKNNDVGGGGTSRHIAREQLRAARDRGVEFHLIGPLRDDLPAEIETVWHPIRPGTDVALMLGIAHTLVSEGRHDRAFLDRFCVGYELFEAYLLGLRDAQPKDAAWAAEICGLPADEIISLARRAAGRRTLITCSQSVQRAEHGKQPVWMGVVLATLLGQIGLPGGGFAYALGSTSNTGKPAVAVPVPTLPQGGNSITDFIPVARLADMLLRPGEPFDFNGQRLAYPGIRLVYWAGGNPFHHHQDLNRLQRAWQKPQTVIVHESWWTPTARHADIVLPATTTLERNDVGGSTRDTFVLAMHRAIDPIGDAKNDFDIFRALARHLGYESAFTEDRDEMAWCQWVYDQVRASATAKGVALPGFQQFWAEGFIELPPPQRDYVLFEDFRRDPERHPLKTPSGRIEIVSEAVAGFDYADCPPHPAWIPPAEWLGSAAAQRWPIHLVTHQPASRLHAQMDPGPVSRRQKVAGREPVRINPQDAARRGIRDGDVVRLFNPRGACLAGAVVDADVMPGVVVMATGAWFDPADAAGEPERHGNPNVLTLDIGTSPLAQATSALTALVEIERWDQPAPAVRAFTPPIVAAAG